MSTRNICFYEEISKIKHKPEANSFNKPRFNYTWYLPDVSFNELI